mmetsp:Transcript_13716/g.24485  ORF Transcript_13716/g.24485 Transcript_13716/m.24485 type:complete len:202 (-) Transcript_13716:1894-2499(-)
MEMQKFFAALLRFHGIRGGVVLLVEATSHTRKHVFLYFFHRRLSLSVFAYRSASLAKFCSISLKIFNWVTTKGSIDPSCRFFQSGLTFSLRCTCFTYKKRVQTSTGSSTSNQSSRGLWWGYRGPLRRFVNLLEKASKASSLGHCQRCCWRRLSFFLFFLYLFKFLCFLLEPFLLGCTFLFFDPSSSFLCLLTLKLIFPHVL